MRLCCTLFEYLPGYLGTSESEMRHEALGEILVLRCNSQAEINKRNGITPVFSIEVSEK